MPRRTTHRRRFLTQVGDPSDPDGLFTTMQQYLEHLGIKGHTPTGIHNVERHIRSTSGEAVCVDGKLNSVLYLCSGFDAVVAKSQRDFALEHTSQDPACACDLQRSPLPISNR